MSTPADSLQLPNESITVGETPTTVLTLNQQLETLEQRWFAILNAERGGKPLPENARGEIRCLTGLSASHRLAKYIDLSVAED